MHKQGHRQSFLHFISLYLTDCYSPLSSLSFSSVSVPVKIFLIMHKYLLCLGAEFKCNKVMSYPLLTEKMLA